MQAEACAARENIASLSEQNSKLLSQLTETLDCLVSKVSGPTPRPDGPAGGRPIVSSILERQHEQAAMIRRCLNTAERLCGEFGAFPADNRPPTRNL